MTKTIALLIGVVALSLAGCAKVDEGNNSSTTQEQSNPSSVPPSSST